MIFLRSDTFLLINSCARGISGSAALQCIVMLSPGPSILEDGYANSVWFSVSKGWFYDAPCKNSGVFGPSLVSGNMLYQKQTRD